MSCGDPKLLLELDHPLLNLPYIECSTVVTCAHKWNVSTSICMRHTSMTNVFRHPKHPGNHLHASNALHCHCAEAVILGCETMEPSKRLCMRHGQVAHNHKTKQDLQGGSSSACAAEGCMSFVVTLCLLNKALGPKMFDEYFASLGSRSTAPSSCTA